MECLSKKSVIFLIIYEIFAFILGSIIIYSYISIVFQTDIDIPKTIILSLGFNLMSSSLYHIRKIYKACIQGKILDNNDDLSRTMKRIGYVVYFMFRPLFSLFFSLIAVIGIKFGVISMTIGGMISLNFIYASIFICTIIGFSTGSFLRYIEINAKKVARRIVGD